MKRVTFVIPDYAGGMEREKVLEVEESLPLREALALAGLDPEEVGVVLGPEGPLRYDALVPPPDRLKVLPPLAAG